MKKYVLIAISGEKGRNFDESPLSVHGSTLIDEARNIDLLFLDPGLYYNISRHDRSNKPYNLPTYFLSYDRSEEEALFDSNRRERAIGVVAENIFSIIARNL